MATALERQISAESNRRYVRKLVAQRGWTETLEAQALALFDMALLRMAASLPAPSWGRWYALAYENGHNVHHLGGMRLGHYAHCYADVCEEVQDTLSLGYFWAAWETGDTFEGTPDGNWHYASRMRA